MDFVLPVIGSLSNFIATIKSFIAILLSLNLSLTGATASVIGFTEGTPITATRIEYCYDNDRLLLGGYNYNATAYADDEHISYVTEAGLDFLICQVTEEFLTKCDNAGIGVIAKNYNAPALYYDFDDIRMQNWLSLDASAYKDHPCLWGDDMIDEPTSAVFGKLSNMLSNYYDNTTGKMPYINLFPMYALSQQLGNEPQISTSTQLLLPNTDYSDEQIDQYKRHVSDYINTIDTDYISVDIYPYNQTEEGEKKTNDAWLRNVDILAEACRETDRDLWIIVQSTGNCVDDGGYMRWCDDVYDISQQAYVSLAFGAKAIIYACYNTGWWDPGSHLIDSDGNRTDTYYAVKEVNEDLAAFSEVYGDYSYLGTYLTNEKSCAGHKYGLYNGISDVDKVPVTSSQGIITGVFEAKDGSDKKAYVFANMEELGDRQLARFTAQFDEGSVVTVWRNGEAQQIHGDTLSLTLEVGEGVFVTVE